MAKVMAVVKRDTSQKVNQLILPHSDTKSTGLSEQSKVDGIKVKKRQQSNIQVTKHTPRHTHTHARTQNSDQPYINPTSSPYITLNMEKMQRQQRLIAMDTHVPRMQEARSALEVTRRKKSRRKERRKEERGEKDPRK